MAHEFDGKAYEKSSTHQKEWGSRLIDELDLRGTEHVLDLGCGDGALTVKIAHLVPNGEVIGIDSSQCMIDVAGPKAARNVQFRLMDINDLAFEQTFDVVFSNAALHWVSDHRRLLESIHRVLSPGGLVRLQFAGSGNCAYFFGVIRQAMSIGRFKSAFGDFQWPWYMPSVDEYRALVQSSPLSAAHVWGENADRHFADAESMISWIDQPSIVPFLAHLNSECKEPFRDYVVAKMIEETRQSDGRCFETFRRINLKARR